VCCSVLQCVAVCCSVLQCVAVCCSVLYCRHHRITRQAFVEEILLLKDALNRTSKEADISYLNVYVYTYSTYNVYVHIYPGSPLY